MMEPDREQGGLAWQIGVWNRMSEVYQREIDRRFESVVDAVIARAALAPGGQVLDLGTGTGAAALRAAGAVGTKGQVTGVDISGAMLDLARGRARSLGLRNLRLLEGAAESIPASNGEFDVVLACLSLMFVIDREAAAREISRVLRPGGRLVAAVWAAPEECDIVLFQQTAGRFACTPPVPGVGPGALADAGPMLRQFAQAGIQAHVESETLGFDFDDFRSAWDTLAGVTTAHLPSERQNQAKAAVMAVMYPHGDGPRHFRNMTQFIVGRK